ncbi:hypothetical protein GF380_06300 [Candidatus Uhrbacteria bacterium]|nr:hypothetical protein [Candidatus Uhrbacteria bacterium]
MKKLFGDRPFDPEWLLGKVFNVICVTITARDFHKFHKPIFGLAEVKRKTSDGGEVQYVVEFTHDVSLPRILPLVSVRNGLSGAALVLVISWENDCHWALYTDTPSPHPDREDEVITTQSLRRHALNSIYFNRHD